ncbi:Lrp/AsnC family transcriptional regulator [Amphritea sp. 2_MG-2023]|uniref:Lrp/AsnC family transcriptional regulator n=1 Tax=Amphritea TaxID=515417 RepID=UPI001C06BFB0|nr:MULTISPECIES: Lrp/AsnC family transcriptional regulator [Amphritea]MBU2964227.1 Lrp/AsnC family transcriptional regulator [Amphritea atlantica]MDO6419516.1 Lrp/AsnC family transcriptional regulator [Amphritea sp. 2_MG-2023]
MDSTDKKILNLLQQDITLSVADIAEQANLSTTPCWKRIKRLESAGIIKARVVLLDSKKIGVGVSVFVHIKTQQHEEQWLKQFAEAILSFEEVMECYRMAGEWDYLLRVVTKDIDSFDRFYKKLITDVKGLTDVTSSFAMEEIKFSTRLPLSYC